MTDEPEIMFQLTPDEALVLFEWAARFTDDDVMEFRHPAERAAIWSLNGALERVLVAVVAPNYHELLHAARTRLAERAGVADEDSSGGAA
jgi:hypothetical protein